MKTRRWYLSIFSQLLDICVNNAWLTYRWDMKRKGVTKHKLLKEFWLEIYKALLHEGASLNVTSVEDMKEKEKIKKPKRSRPVDDVRFDP